MEMTMEEDSFEDDIVFCPTCRLILYPTDDSNKFFLLSCRACNHEVRLDYEFTWEKHKVNKKSILPPVRKQNAGTCCPNAVLTSLDARLNFNRALMNKGPAEMLSLDHLLEQYSEEEERKTGLKYDGSKGYKLRETAHIIRKKGVLHEHDYASKNRQGKSWCRARHYPQKNASFTEICNKILKGNVLFTSIPVTEQWSMLKAGDMYMANRDLVITEYYDNKPEESWHAIVLVGFGQEGGVEYFRFQNSYGTRFCENGIGIVRAREICHIERFEPYYVNDN
ncbi:pro-cathepsin H isoform X3 [Brachypodium distachyon]|uniref:Peptidase C1A papain C-terminal domain-containing protein n=2 Tax=Brachypodium distachyon TaxID=15368 RepID=A0A0Q3N2E4_BRADI|nr:pro-cathepsin H isoform X3 [Brachypodium distachyon]KQK10822.1 hypothetical protein BRADI_2g56416v3 [Brachypodium distachyon]|eukprot:XP_010232624.1 pro-cathepsin H isoform X3 [Brachypodium distachyon]